MALNTLHNVTLSEAQISIILYTLEDYMSKGNTSNDPDLPKEIDNIFDELEGTIDKHYDKIEAAKKKQPKAEWQPLKCNPIEYERIMNISDLLCDLYDIRRMAELEGFGNLPKDNEGTETTIFECLDNCITQLLEEQRNVAPKV